MEGYGFWGEPFVPCKHWDHKKDYCKLLKIYDPPCICRKYEKEIPESRKREIERLRGD